MVFTPIRTEITLAREKYYRISARRDQAQWRQKRFQSFRSVKTRCQVCYHSIQPDLGWQISRGLEIAPFDSPNPVSLGRLVDLDEPCAANLGQGTMPGAIVA